MKNITIEIVKDGNIEQCRDLCNELMAFQKSVATMLPEVFDNMNYETRLKSSFENSTVNQLIVAKDNGVPIGYVFSTIENIEDGDKSNIPDWVPIDSVKDIKGFYPDWNKLPEKAGCLNQLYFRNEYRGIGLGSKLFNMAIEWIESFHDINLTFVYISNGNNAALDFYLKRGFAFSHDVFGGFIQAAYKVKAKPKNNQSANL